MDIGGDGGKGDGPFDVNLAKTKTEKLVKQTDLLRKKLEKL